MTAVGVTVRIPTQLRTLTNGAGTVNLEGSTVGEVLAALDSSHPGFAGRLFDDSGALRRFVNVFLADEDVRFLDGLETPVAAGQTLSIVPAVAGGASDEGGRGAPAPGAPFRCPCGAVC